MAAPAPPLRHHRCVFPPERTLELRTSSCTRTNALLLAALPLFLGGIGGIHHFYTGRIFFGFLQLITCGGLFVWAIIDMVNIAQGNFRDSQDRPLQRC
ncbi:MAG: hypothetical protein CMJ83_13120 [Planctomycetes bacterium]|nr:hypothetical protein [Planctomycetota bacterium]